MKKVIVKLGPPKTHNPDEIVIDVKNKEIWIGKKHWLGRSPKDYHSKGRQFDFILAILVNCPGSVFKESIIEHIYGSEIDGPPLYVDKIVYIMILRMRPILEWMGVSIKMDRWGSHYRADWIQPEGTDAEVPQQATSCRRVAVAGEGRRP